MNYNLRVKTHVKKKKSTERQYLIPAGFVLNNRFITLDLASLKTYLSLRDNETMILIYLSLLLF